MGVSACQHGTHATHKMPSCQYLSLLYLGTITTAGYLIGYLSHDDPFYSSLASHLPSFLSLASSVLIDLPGQLLQGFFHNETFAAVCVVAACFELARAIIKWPALIDTALDRALGWQAFAAINLLRMPCALSDCATHWLGQADIIIISLLTFRGARDTSLTALRAIRGSDEGQRAQARATLRTYAHTAMTIAIVAVMSCFLTNAFVICFMLCLVWFFDNLGVPMPRLATVPFCPRPLPTLAWGVLPRQAMLLRSQCPRSWLSVPFRSTWQATASKSKNGGRHSYHPSSRTTSRASTAVSYGDMLPRGFHLALMTSAPSVWTASRWPPNLQQS